MISSGKHVSGCERKCIWISIFAVLLFALVPCVRVAHAVPCSSTSAIDSGPDDSEICVPTSKQHDTWDQMSEAQREAAACKDRDPKDCEWVDVNDLLPPDLRLPLPTFFPVWHVECRGLCWGNYIDGMPQCPGKMGRRPVPATCGGEKWALANCPRPDAGTFYVCDETNPIMDLCGCVLSFNPSMQAQACGKYEQKDPDCTE